MEMPTALVPGGQRNRLMITWAFLSLCEKNTETDWSSRRLSCLCEKNKNRLITTQAFLSLCEKNAGGVEHGGRVGSRPETFYTSQEGLHHTWDIKADRFELLSLESFPDKGCPLSISSINTQMPLHLCSKKAESFPLCVHAPVTKRQAFFPL